MLKTLAGLSMMVLATQATAAQPSYTLTPLGLPNAPGCAAHGFLTPVPVSINDAGHVAGIYCFVTTINGTQQGIVHGFFWTPQRGAVDIGLPPGTTDPRTSVWPRGINNRGEIVGYVLNSIGENAFTWHRGRGMTVIASHAYAVGVNDLGQVAGGLGATAFLFSRGMVTDLGTIPGAGGSNAFGINNLGHIAGTAPLPTTPFTVTAILWTGGQWRNLGIPAGDATVFPFGINNFDEIVGISFDANGHYRAFLWNGDFTILPCLSGQECDAAAINDAGTIVGFFSHGAAVWIGGAVFDLNTLIDPRDPLRGQVDLGQGESINGRGDITAIGFYTSGPHNGDFEAFVLHPVERHRHNGEDE
jgi:probable HAF family extracellular repeat protein